MTPNVIASIILVVVWIGALSIAVRENNAVRNYARLLYYAIIHAEAHSLAQFDTQEESLRTTPRPQQERSRRSSQSREDNAVELENLRAKLYEAAKRLEKRGKALYEQNRTTLEAKFWGQFVVFNVNTGEYVIGSTLAEVYDLREQRLSCHQTWGCRIGEPILERALL